MVGVSDFHNKILRRATSEDDFRVYKAALEWDLTDPIVLESAEDFKSSPRWKDRLTPYHHQVTNLITFCRRLPVTLLADDVGLGKTISAGLVISELAARSRLSKVLVVCPKILGPQWESELTSKFDIPAKFVTGRDLLKADFDELGVVITTYNSARLYLDQIPEDRFQMLILDEAHKLRNLYGVENPPKVAKCFHRALQSRRFRFVLMLTATPIHNRLWDLYSLVELLTAGRGHQNPFGSPGLFARKFIADDKEKARQLRSSAVEEFRSIVYGYMSRVRRGDARLHFPERIVKRHQVDPTPAELELIEIIAKPIQSLNRLVQISILKALASSPEALNAQLKNMARNGTIPASLSRDVNAVVEGMPPTAKLTGLAQLIGLLKKQDPNGWRLVIFTALRETQTTIQLYLESQGFKVGIVNGDSGLRNQETIQAFRADPPLYRIIVSTEAGAEGVNLQAANVLVNYDLPWNPMIVEQRIGRIQRLASWYENVVVYNITLRGTFEEYIVGRLVEKLQMAADAIGDIDSLLQGADTDDDDDNDGESFEDRLLKLVLKALAAKDQERATELEIESIEEAINTLERERKNIEGLLGDADGRGYVGPKAPSLPPNSRSMELEEFSLAALRSLGASVQPHQNNLYAISENGGSQYIRFEATSSANVKSTYYGQETTVFQKLVDQVIASGIHRVEDVDVEPEASCRDVISKWVEKFGGVPRRVEIDSVDRRFEGTALVRVRATVLHDSYERLVNVRCYSKDHAVVNGRSLLRPTGHVLADPTDVGINLERLSEAVDADDGISEFSRFYLERREQETQCAGGDERKRQKLYDEFTPRFEASVVSLEGTVYRTVSTRATFSIDEGNGYEASLIVVPHGDRLEAAPPFDLCTKTGKSVPKTCLARCDVTGANVLKHILVRSEASGRSVLPEYIEICELSGQKVVGDELAVSDVSGRRIVAEMLRKSEISGKLAEPTFLGRCAFTEVMALKSELLVSDISGQFYRHDEQAVSEVSGKRGHKSEFIKCAETHQLMARSEAERCDESGRYVRPGVLITCESSQERVLPSLCARCSVTGKRVLRRMLVTSSVSEKLLLPDAAIKSRIGKCCCPEEAMRCAWDGGEYHPEDVGICSLTGLSVHQKYLAWDKPGMVPLLELLNDAGKETSAQNYPIIEAALAKALDGQKCKVVSGVISPTGTSLAICGEIKAFLGLKTIYVGAIFSPQSRSVVGKVVRGRRTKLGWEQID